MTMADRRDAGDDEWFPTSSSRRLVQMEHGAGWVLGGMVHARELGSVFTACGEFAPAWPTLFDGAFDATTPAACRDCAIVVVI